MKKKIDAKRLIAVCCIMLMISSMLLLAGCSKPFTGDKSEEKQITTLAELNGHTIYADMGTTNATALVNCEALKDSEILFSTDRNDGLQKMITGKADAYVCDSLFAQETVAKYNSMTVLEESLNDELYGFAFPKNSQYRDEFNTELNKLIQNGTLDELANKWINKAPDADPKLAVQDWAGSKGEWRVAASLDEYPLAYLDEEGQPQGFDLDVILAIARELDYSVEINNIVFTSLLANIGAGNYDIGAGGITITEDRENIVDFSDPYYKNSTVIIVKNLQVGDNKAEALKLTVGNALYKVFIENDRYLLLLKGIKTTILFVLASLFVSVVSGFLLFLWKYSGSWFANKIVTALQNFIQFIPGMVWLFMIYYIVFTGTSANGFVAALVAFAFQFGTVIDFYLEGAIGRLSEGQREATFAMGYSKYQALYKIYLPQAMPIFLNGIAFEMVGMVKSTALVELVAVFDIQAAADTILNESQVPFLPLFLPAVIYAIIGLAVYKVILYLAKKAAEHMEDPEAIKEKVLKGRI